MNSASLALQLAMDVSPNGKVQEAFAQLYRDAITEGMDPLIPLLDAMLDGLRLGNWPQIEKGD